MVHRPGLEHTRLTPTNAEELLFDDVIWVARAKAEHDMFVEVMRDRGIEVFLAEELLAGALAKPEAKDWVSSHILSERQVGITASRQAREWVQTAEPATVAEFFDRRDDQGRHPPGRGIGVEVGGSVDAAAAAAAELPIPARLLVLDLQRGNDQPDDQAGPGPGNDDHGSDLPVPPDVRR
jgi:hypothetical protein